jgi:hypothetical protein
MSGPFKMKGSPMQRNFGISPMKQKEKQGLNIKKIAKKIYNAPGKAAIDLWHKYGPTINPSTKNPKGWRK